jgi:hypothetical protein
MHKVRLELDDCILSSDEQFHPHLQRQNISPCVPASSYRARASTQQSAIVDVGFVGAADPRREAQFASQDLVQPQERERRPRGVTFLIGQDPIRQPIVSFSLVVFIDCRLEATAEKKE